MYIYTTCICILSKNITFIYSAFLTCFTASASTFYIYQQCAHIVFILQCQTVQKQLPNFTKESKSDIVLIAFKDVHYHVRYYTVTWCSFSPLRSICVTNDHGYVSFVVITIQSFPHSWLVTEFVTRVTWRVPRVEQVLPPFRSTWVHALF